MKDVMIKEPSRPTLNEERIQQCHDIVNDLVRLHSETDPSYGHKSEYDKDEKALQALNKVGMLSAILTEWAESHILGRFYNASQSKDNWLDMEKTNSHDNELMWFKPKISEEVFEDDNFLMSNRYALATIIRNTFRMYGPTGWRMPLSEGLEALNDGQVNWLLKPINTKLQGYAYDLQKLKNAATHHVYRLMGEGWKKTAAQQKVAECCGTTFEAIKKWEKKYILEMDRKKEFLNGIKRGSMALTECKKYPEYDPKLFLECVVNGYLSEDKNIDPATPDKNFLCDIILCVRLGQEFPLESLKDRLIEAGMRKSD